MPSKEKFDFLKISWIIEISILQDKKTSAFSNMSSKLPHDIYRCQGFSLKALSPHTP